jgi:hypothetical protein
VPDSPMVQEVDVVMLILVDYGDIERQYNVSSDMTVVEPKEDMAGTASVEHARTSMPPSQSGSRCLLKMLRIIER